MKPTLHILSNPSGITHTRYRMEPFNVAALKFIENMKKRGWDMIHYGHESAGVECENEICVTNDDFPPPEDGSLLVHQPHLEQIYNNRAIDIVTRRKKPGDMLLAFYGLANKPTMDAHPDLSRLEPSIGYPPETVYSPYRAFVSYSQMHYYYGLHKMLLKPSWFDAVIPNAFTPSEFEFNDKKQDYFVYLGRVNYDKGIDLCVQVTKQLGKKLYIAGPTDTLRHLGYDSIPDHVELTGYVNPKQRSDLLSNAQCLMAPTHYIEPFGNMIVEAYLSGTPAITTDWGAFTETVVQGVTGYRCREFREFVSAIKNIDSIDPFDCYKFALKNYTHEVVYRKHDAYLQKVIAMDFYRS